MTATLTTGLWWSLPSRRSQPAKSSNSRWVCGQGELGKPLSCTTACKLSWRLCMKAQCATLWPHVQPPTTWWLMAHSRAAAQGGPLTTTVQAGQKVVGALIRPWDNKMLKPGRRQKKKRQCRLHLKVGVWLEPGKLGNELGTRRPVCMLVGTCQPVPARKPPRGTCARGDS